MPQENQLLLKLSFPFCYRKCAYCGQNVCSYDDKVLKAYGQAMEAEMEAAAAEMPDAVIPAISIEGGSPALASPEMLQNLLRFMRKNFPLAEDVQIQIQIMPGQFSRSLIQRLQDTGVNFWTIGLETADLKEHDLLGRPYRFDALTMVDTAIRTFHMEKLNFSLLYGIPGQTLRSWRHTLDAALAYAPDHLTLNPLRLIPGTPLAHKCQKGELTACSWEILSQYYEYAKELLLSLGYEAYTITDFCRPGCENRWRLSHLSGTPYMGFGYQADSCFDGVFYTNGHSLKEYLEHSADLPVIAHHMVRLDRRSQMLRFALSRLTLTQGLDTQELNRRFGQEARQLTQEVLLPLINKGFLTGTAADLYDDSSSAYPRYARLTPLGIASGVLRRLEHM